MLGFGASARIQITSTLAAFPALLILGGCQLVLNMTESESAKDDLKPSIPPDGSCTIDMPFKTPEFFTELNSKHSEEGLRILDDGLKAYFWSDRRSSDPLQRLLSMDVFVATRATPDEPFGTPQLFEPLSTEFLGELYPTEPADGLTVYFDRNWKPEPNPDIWPERHIFRVRRSATDQKFGPIEEVTALRSLENISSGDVSPYVVPDGSALYFASNRFAGGVGVLDMDIFRAELVDGEVRKVEYLEALSLRGETDLNPVVTPDELTIYFASTRSSKEHYFNIWVASRPSRNVPFSKPQIARELNALAHALIADVSPDNCVVYGYAAGSNFDNPSADMFRAERKR